MTEDPRTQGRDICGITQRKGNTEFICINTPHDPEYMRRSTDKNHRGMTSGTGSDPKRGRAPYYAYHYFVDRWPNRKKEQDG